MTWCNIDNDALFLTGNDILKDLGQLAVVWSYLEPRVDVRGKAQQRVLRNNLTGSVCAFFQIG